MSDDDIKAIMAIGLLFVVAPAVLVYLSVRMMDSESRTSDVLAGAAAVMSWMPLILGIVLSIGDGNPTVDILYGAAITVISAGIIARRRTSRP